MAADIIPIQLSLTQGDVLTLWATRWVEDDEEWEAFLGHGDHLYVLPDAAHLAAFIRSDAEHDLLDHPSWPQARTALADELIPDDDHLFDIVGIPELVASPPNVWSLAELADTVAILHSIAEVCDLEVIDEVLGSSDGFAAAAEGQSAFLGRAGKKLWHEIGTVVAGRWDAIIEALDGIVTVPDTDPDAVAEAADEIDAVARGVADDSADTPDEIDDGDEAERDPDLAFWDEVGIDCLAVTAGGRTGWTLRCYLGEAPVFLGADGKVALYPSPAALETYLTDEGAENTLSHLDAWAKIRDAIDAGEASVIAGPENTYVLDGLDDAMLGGPLEVDAAQLTLAAELLDDAATARGDDEVSVALSTATALGNLVRAITQPDPDRLPPSPPFDDEAAAWRTLVDAFETSLDWR